MKGNRLAIGRRNLPESIMVKQFLFFRLMGIHFGIHKRNAAFIYSLILLPIFYVIRNKTDEVYRVQSQA